MNPFAEIIMFINCFNYLFVEIPRLRCGEFYSRDAAFKGDPSQEFGKCEISGFRLIPSNTITVISPAQSITVDVLTEQMNFLVPRFIEILRFSNDPFRRPTALTPAREGNYAE